MSRWCITSPYMETPMPTTFDSREAAEAFVASLQSDADETFQHLTVEEQ